MDAPDEMEEAVARVIHDGRSMNATPWVSLSDHECARAVLSVPELDEMFARDARVRELRDNIAAQAAYRSAQWVAHGFAADRREADALWAIVNRLDAALYPEAGK